MAHGLQLSLSDICSDLEALGMWCVRHCCLTVLATEQASHPTGILDTIAAGDAQSQDLEVAKSDIDKLIATGAPPN